MPRLLNLNKILLLKQFPVNKGNVMTPPLFHADFTTLVPQRTLNAICRIMVSMAVLIHPVKVSFSLPPVALYQGDDWPTATKRRQQLCVL